MFENDKISSVQMMRILILSTLGVSILSTTEISISFGERDGLFCILFGYLFTLGLTALVFSLIKKQRHLREDEQNQRRLSKLSDKLFAGIFIVKYQHFMQAKRGAISNLRHPLIFHIHALFSGNE